MKLIIGLGNPGSIYLKTRHNIGFVIVDFIINKLDLELDTIKFNGHFVKNKNFIIAKPMTYMNLSGEFISQIIKFYKIEIEDILVIHDDMDIPLGKFVIRKQGTSGGQNGMKNIIYHLGTTEINRIRIGIGRKQNTSSSYVLGKFSLDEKQEMHDAIKSSIDASIDFLSHNINYVMNKYNKK